MQQEKDLYEAANKVLEGISLSKLNRIVGNDLTATLVNAHNKWGASFTVEKDGIHIWQDGKHEKLNVNEKHLKMMQEG
jgi:hypothetical protein